MKTKQMSSTSEVPIDPELPICDSHHHFCDFPNRMRLPFAYTVDDLIADIKEGHNIVKTVFMNCDFRYKSSGSESMSPVGETEAVQGIAAKHDLGSNRNIQIAAGIVGFADMALGDAVSPVIEAHIAASPERLRGIRHMSAWDDSPEVVSKFPPKGLLMSSQFRQGIIRLKKYNLNFEAWVYHPQIHEVVDLARAFPDLPIILDHIGGPLGVGPYAVKKKEVFQDWRLGINTLATCPNVSIKIGGFGVSMLGFNWTNNLNSIEIAEIMKPYILWCVEKFGVNRCMFESDFPVDKVAFRYTTLWNAYKRVTRDFTDKEKAALFYDTAVKVYRLN